MDDWTCSRKGSFQCSVRCCLLMENPKVLSAHEWYDTGNLLTRWLFALCDCHRVKGLMNMARRPSMGAICKRNDYWLNDWTLPDLHGCRGKLMGKSVGSVCGLPRCSFPPEGLLVLTWTPAFPCRSWINKANKFGKVPLCGMWITSGKGQHAFLQVNQSLRDQFKALFLWILMI